MNVGSDHELSIPMSSSFTTYQKRWDIRGCTASAFKISGLTPLIGSLPQHSLPVEQHY